MTENGHEDQAEKVLIGKRCYVGNLAWKTSWQDLKDIFRDCGDVVYSNVMREDNGRSKGWGIVEFSTPAEALQAISTLNGTELHGRNMLVREDREDRDVKNYINKKGGGNGAPRGRGRGRGRGGRRGGRGARGAADVENKDQSSGFQIVVQGIPWAWTSADLQSKFTEIGEIEASEISMSHDGRSRGFGTVRFSTQEAATEAINKFNQTEVEGRNLAIFLDRYA